MAGQLKSFISRDDINVYVNRDYTTLSAIRITDPSTGKAQDFTYVKFGVGLTRKENLNYSWINFNSSQFYENLIIGKDGTITPVQFGKD